MTFVRLAFLSVSILFASVSNAGTTSGSIGVSLRIVEASATSTSVNSNPAQMRESKALSILTDAKDGAVVDVYINRQQVASTRSIQGVVNFEINWKVEDNMKLELRSGGKVLQTLQTAYINHGSTTAPKMYVEPQVYKRQIQVTHSDGSHSMKTVEVKSIVVEY